MQIKSPSRSSSSPKEGNAIHAACEVYALNKRNEVLPLLPPCVRGANVRVELFRHTVEGEAWWALESLHFTGRHVLAQTWPFEESGKRLEQALCLEVAVHADTNEAPIYTDTKLQTIIQDWEPARQTQAIQGHCRSFRR